MIYNQNIHFTLEELSNHFSLPLDLIIEKLILINILDEKTQNITEFSINNKYADYITLTQNQSNGDIEKNIYKNSNVFFTNDSVAYILVKLGKDLDYNIARIIKKIKNFTKIPPTITEDKIVKLIYNSYKKNDEFSVKLFNRINNENLVNEFLKFSFSQELISTFHKIALEKKLNEPKNEKLKNGVKLNKI